MLKKKKTTASGKLVLVKSVRRTRSHRMKFCVQRGLEGAALNKQTAGNVSVYYTRIACRICVWLSTRIACLYLKQPKRPLGRCGKSTKI